MEARGEGRKGSRLLGVDDDPPGQVEDELGGLEAQLAELLSSRGGRPIDPHEVVIDVPESISFEVDIDVEGAPAATQTVFDRDVVAGFHRQLRAVTILAPEDAVTPSHVQPALAEVLGEH